MEPSLTVVLPIHNAERTLRHDVTDVLEAASELTPLVDVLIVDDGSLDDSFEVANDLARAYRQVRVVRRSRRLGLSESLREIRQQIESDVVIVHDGASRINPEQLRLVWKQQQVLGAFGDSSDRGVSFADLRRPAATQPMMENAHRRLLGFRFAEKMSSPANEAEPNTNQRTDEASEAKPAVKPGMGAIPPLPKTGMFGALTDFALGE